MWSYSGNPGASGKDAVRFLVADTEYDSQLVQDEEITWAISENKNVYAAAALVAEAMAAKFASQADSVQIGPIKEEARGRAKAYADLALALKVKASKKRSLGVVGGITDSDPTFSTGMTDNEGQSYSSIFGNGGSN